MTDREPLIDDLRRWADARDKRYENDHAHRAHGKTGTSKLREAADEIERLRAGLEELLDIAERSRGGDTSLDPERWFAARDYARLVLKRSAAVGNNTESATQRTTPRKACDE